MATMTLPTTHDEAIATADAEVARLEAKLAANREAIAIGRAEAARLAEAMAAPPSQHPRLIAALGTPTSATSWQGVPPALEHAQHRVPDLERALRDARSEAERLRGSRIPAIDDAIADTKRRALAVDEAAARSRAALVDAHDWRRALAVRVAMGEAQAADVAAADATIASLEAAVRDADAKRAELGTLLEDLATRRADAVRQAEAKHLGAGLEAWRTEQVRVARAARELAAAGATLLRLADAHPEILRSVDARAVLWAPGDLEVLVTRADHLALRAARPSSEVTP